MEIVFYSTHCPRCRVLEKKLQEKNIQYTEVDDVVQMQELGLKNAPALSIDGAKPMNFTEAIKWINGVKADGNN